MKGAKGIEVGSVAEEFNTHFEFNEATLRLLKTSGLIERMTATIMARLSDAVILDSRSPIEPLHIHVRTRFWAIISGCLKNQRGRTQKIAETRLVGPVANEAIVTGRLFGTHPESLHKPFDRNSQKALSGHLAEDLRDFLLDRKEAIRCENFRLFLTPTGSIWGEAISKDPQPYTNGSGHHPEVVNIINLIDRS